MKESVYKNAMCGLMCLIFHLFTKKRQRWSTAEFRQTLQHIAYVLF